MIVMHLNTQTLGNLGNKDRPFRFEFIFFKFLNAGNKINDHDSDIDSQDEEAIRKFCSSSIFDDVLLAIYEVRLTAPFVALVAIFLAYHISVAPYRVHVDHGNEGPTTSTEMDLNTVRPVLSSEKMQLINTNLFEAVTSLELPDEETITFKFHTKIDNFGIFRLPAFFYEGVVFGITSQNPFHIQHTSYSQYTLDDLYEDLSKHLSPPPTFIMKRSAVSNNTLWQEEGYAVYYSYQTLQSTGKLSNLDKQRPWKRIGDKVIELARKYRQSYVTVWYPTTFGVTPTAPAMVATAATADTAIADIQMKERGEGQQHQPQHDPHRRRPPRGPKVTTTVPLDTNKGIPLEDHYKHKAIIQEIVPTRTGLHGLKLTNVVWLASVDGFPPHMLDYVNTVDW